MEFCRSAETLFFHTCSGLEDEVVAMSSLSRELVFLILQFLDEEKFKETVHKYVPFSILMLQILAHYEQLTFYIATHC